MSLLKNLQILFYCAVFFTACTTGPDNNAKNNGDTLEYIEEDPGTISKADFERYYAAVNAFYDTNLVARGFNGSILVAKNGRIIFEKYHGYADLVKKDTLTSSSSFHLASVTKTFTAMAILKLAEQNKLRLDDDVKVFFPNFPYDSVTIRMLLSHRSSLPNYLYFMEKFGWDKTVYCDNNDVLDYIIRFKPPLNRKPGTGFNYCNTNYVLLALIIEKASGETYAGFLQHTFLSPLKMKDTYVFSLEDSIKAMPSYNWKGIQEPLTFLDKTYGDKNMYGTAGDLLKWDRALYGNKLFTQETLETAFKPYSNEKPGIRNYGFGWRMNIYPNGKKIIFHGGWWHGNNTMLMRLVQDSATIIILGNKYNRNVYEARKLANLFSNYFETDEDDNSETSNDTAVKNNPKLMRLQKKN